MDIIARFGADEFVLCLSGLTSEEAVQKLEAIRRDVSAKAAVQGEFTADLTIGALVLDREEDFRRGLQDILGALGKVLVQAKGERGKSIAIGRME